MRVKSVYNANSRLYMHNREGQSSWQGAVSGTLTPPIMTPSSYQRLAAHAIY